MDSETDLEEVTDVAPCKADASSVLSPCREDTDQELNADWLNWDRPVLEVDQKNLTYHTAANYLYLATWIRELHHHNRALADAVPVSAPDPASSTLSEVEQADLAYHAWLHQSAKVHPFPVTFKPIRTVMLTGATGFLGCHLLAELMLQTTYKVLLPVRASNAEHAFERVDTQYQRYFDTSLREFGDRIIVEPAVLSEPGLGIDTRRLAGHVPELDSIIHCAAAPDNPDQSAESRPFNLSAMANLLEFAETALIRDFHYISCLEALRGANETAVLVNPDAPTAASTGETSRLRSKLCAEQMLCDYRHRGIRRSIYRVANLIQNNRDGEAILEQQVQKILAEVRTSEPSGIEAAGYVGHQSADVKATADAIIQLFDKTELADQTYHLYTPQPLEFFQQPGTADFSAQTICALQIVRPPYVDPVCVREISRNTVLLFQ